MNKMQEAVQTCLVWTASLIEGENYKIKTKSTWKLQKSKLISKF